MTPLSKRRLREGVADKLYTITFSLLGQRASKSEFLSIMNAIQSPTERLVLAKRIAILYLLIKKIDYAIIQDVLKVSTSTISKCVAIITNSEQLTNTLKKLANHEHIKDLFLEVFSGLYGPGTYGVNWTNAWKRRNEIQRKKKEGI